MNSYLYDDDCQFERPEIEWPESPDSPFND